MWPMLAMGALSMAGSVMSGIGQKNASAKQARLQMMADAAARAENERILAEVNAKRRELGEALMNVPEVSSSTVDVDAMVASARKAGINPITYLQAGGLQAHSSTMRMGHNAAAAFSMMVPEYQLTSASQVPQQYSTLQAIGGGITAGAGMMSQMYSIDAKSSATDKMLAAVMKGAGAAYGNSISGGGSFGSKVTMGGPTGTVGGLSMKTGKDGTWPGWDLGFPEVTSFKPLWQVDKKSPDAQGLEDRYHEVGGLIGGIWNIANDGNIMMRGQPLYKEPWFKTTVQEAKAINQAWDNVPVWMESKGLWPWKSFYGNAGSAAP